MSWTMGVEMETVGQLWLLGQSNSSSHVEITHAHSLALMHELASLAETVGGSSGGIYSILLTSAGRAFQD